MVYYLTNFVKMEDKAEHKRKLAKAARERKRARDEQYLKECEEKEKRQREESIKESLEAIPKLLDEIKELRDMHIVALRDKHIPACQRWIAEDRWQETKQPSKSVGISTPWCDVIDSFHQANQETSDAESKAIWEHTRRVQLVRLQGKLKSLENLVLPDAPVSDDEACNLRGKLRDLHRHLLCYVHHPNTVDYYSYFS